MPPDSASSLRCDVHPGFAIEAKTAHIAGSNLYYTDITMRCSTCGARMQFRGPHGVSPHQPTVSILGDTVTLPATPEGEDLRSDKPLPSMSVRSRDPEGRLDG